MRNGCGSRNERDSVSPTERVSPNRRIRLFVAYCAGLLLGYALYVPGRILPGFPAGGPGDFIAFYTGAHIVRDGNGVRLYDFELQSQVQQAFVVPHGWKYQGGLLPFVNPPFVALLFVPLTFVPLAWAYHIWNLAGVLMILFCLWTFLRGPALLPALLLRALVTFSFFPVFEGLWQGQTCFVVLLAFTLSYHALKRGNEGVAGIVLSLGLIKPQLMLIPAATFLYLRRWRMIGAFLFSGTALLSLSWIFVGMNGLLSYFRLSNEMLKWVGVWGMHPTVMPNLRGMAYRIAEWFGFWTARDVTPTWLSLAILACGLLTFMLVVRIWRGQWRISSAEFDLRFADTLVCTLFLSPHLNGHDLSLLVLAGLLVARYFEHSGKIRKRDRMVSGGHIGITIGRLIGVNIALWAQGVALLLAAFMVVLDREDATNHPTGATDGASPG